MMEGRRFREDRGIRRAQEGGESPQSRVPWGKRMGAGAAGRLSERSNVGSWRRLGRCDEPESWKQSDWIWGDEEGETLN